MSLNNLPNELLLRIAWFVLKCPTCDCHHESHHLSSFTRCSRRIHSALTPELLSTASALHILLWAITHARQDTIALAINHGADPNVPLRETHHVPRSTTHVNLGTPLDIAFRLRLRSVDTAAHQLHLDTCSTLLRAGAKPSIESLRGVADCGDEALLRCCLPYTTFADTLLDPAGNPTGPRPLIRSGEWINGPSQVGVPQAPSRDIVKIHFHYHGWELLDNGSWDDWGPWCGRLESERGCMCPVCPPARTGGFCEVRAVGE